MNNVTALLESLTALVEYSILIFVDTQALVDMYSYNYWYKWMKELVVPQEITPLNTITNRHADRQNILEAIDVYTVGRQN